MTGNVATDSLESAPRWGGRYGVTSARPSNSHQIDTETVTDRCLEAMHDGADVNHDESKLAFVSVTVAQSDISAITRHAGAAARTADA